jgi:hypothetical protein
MKKFWIPLVFLFLFLILIGCERTTANPKQGIAASHQVSGENAF